MSGLLEVGGASVFLWVGENGVNPPINALGDPLAFLVGPDKLLSARQSLFRRLSCAGMAHRRAEGHKCTAWGLGPYTGEFESQL